jgi:multidrug efflux pump subunit AcrB
MVTMPTTRSPLQTGMARGMKAADAARAIVGQTTWPLLGATVIAVLAFAPIGLSPDNTGDYCRTLFQVIWISLLLSWVFAITATPVLGCSFLRSVEAGTETDPYGGLVFRLFRGVLEFCLRFRWATLGLLALLLIASAIGFGNVKQGFFPASSRPQFMVDYWRPQGTDIRAVEADIIKLESWLGQQEGVAFGVGSIVPGVAGGKGARLAAQGVHLQAGVVGQGQQRA